MKVVQALESEHPHHVAAAILAGVLLELKLKEARASAGEKPQRERRHGQ